MTVRVLVVDDSSFFRRRVSEILTIEGEMEVIGTAADGQAAVDQAKALRPDVITMDIEMPVLDGISAVREIMDQCPTPILMFSSLTHDGARATLDALEAGALDFLPKKFEDIARNRDEATSVLQQRVIELARKRVSRISKRASTDSVRPAAGKPEPRPSAGLSTSRTSSSLDSSRRTSSFGQSQPSHSAPGTRSASPSARLSGKDSSEARRSDTVAARAESSKSDDHKAEVDTAVDSTSLQANTRYKLLAIGTSTGGPVALQTILTQLPANFPYPILLVQHMPAAFTKAFAQRLNGLCKIEVKEASDGDTLRSGVAYLAPGGTQMLVDGRTGQARLRIRTDDSERITYRPSVDLTFASVSKVFGGQVLGVILTGMGADGREGCRMLKDNGATIWAQDRDSCVVYGMPQAVAAAGISSKDIALNRMAASILTEVGYS